VALEPEASGSTRGVGQQFEKLAQAIDLVGKVDYIKVTLQEYMKDYKLQMFDYVLLHAVINHLDEAATERLHLPDSQAERQRYKNIFRGLYNILNTNGTILIYDVGRRNFWNDFKLKSPFVSTIEYQKHQQPAVWKSLLCESGFEPLDINWFTPFKLRKIRQLLSWWLPIYFINSSFILRMRKPAAYNTPGKTRINLTQSR
jgi:SAM-dependent methyltransferase